MYFLFAFNPPQLILKTVLDKCYEQNSTTSLNGLYGMYDSDCSRYVFNIIMKYRYKIQLFSWFTGRNDDMLQSFYLDLFTDGGDMPDRQYTLTGSSGSVA